MRCGVGGTGGTVPPFKLSVGLKSGNSAREWNSGGWHALRARTEINLKAETVRARDAPKRPRGRNPSNLIR
jgi:hypothetical protein